MDRKRVPQKLLDLFCGFVAFSAVMLVSFLREDIRPFVLITFLAFSYAAFFRVGKTGSNVLGGVLVVFGGILPALALNMTKVAMTSRPFVVAFLTASVSAAMLGVALRLLIGRGKVAYALVLGSASLIAASAVALKTIPDWMSSRAYRSVNRSIAPFRVQMLTGNSLTSESLKGRVVVLSLWATWCTPCKAELPQIEDVARRYSGNPKVLVLALDTGTGGDTMEMAKAYLLKRNVKIEAAIDSGDAESFAAATKSLGVHGIPRLYILDSAGRVRVIHSGYDASENLKESLAREIDRLL